MSSKGSRKSKYQQGPEQSWRLHLGTEVGTGAKETEVEREQGGPHSFHFMASKADKIFCRNTFCLGTLSLGFPCENMEHNPCSKFGKVTEHPSKQVTHAQRAGHQLVRKVEAGVLRSYVWVSCFLTISLIPSQGKNLTLEE